MPKSIACPMCAEKNSAEATVCAFCGADLLESERPAKRRSGDTDQTGGIIPYKNVPALIGYYCAVFSLIPCLGALLGLVALGLGIAGLRTPASNPAARGQAHAWVAIILGGLTALGNWALIGIMILAPLLSKM